MKHLLLKLLPYNTHLYNFCKSYVEKHDGDCNGDIATNGELRVMRQFLPGCSVVFDVGAHTGEWAKLALSVNPGLNIHCFEPSRENFANLTRNVFSPNVTCNPCGLSSENVEKPLFIFRSAPGLHSLYQRRGLESGWGLKTPAETEMVKLDTLENYCAERRIEKIDFLKVDVEGHELEVFKGGRSLFAEDRVRMVQFEYGGCNIDSKVLLKDIFEFFAGMNYRFYKIFPDRLKFFQQYDQRLENFKYQNWLLISETSGTRPRDKSPEAIAPEKSAMERSRLSAREAALVNDLRHEIHIMPEPKAVTDSAAESAWLANRTTLRKCILEEDPREFLTWDVVTGSMFVGNRPFIDSELSYLMHRPDWKQVWEDILEEDFAGGPKPYKGYRQSSGNRIHQAYHLARFEQETGMAVSSVSFDRGVRRRLRKPVPACPQTRVQGAIHHLRPARICRLTEVLPRLARHAADRGEGRCLREAGHPLHIRPLRARFRDAAGSANRPFHRHVVAQRDGPGLPGSYHHAARRRLCRRLSHHLPKQFRGRRQRPVFRCVACKETGYLLGA